MRYLLFCITELQQNVSSSTTVSKYGRARKYKGIITVLQGWGKDYFISQVLTDLIAYIQAKRHSLSLVCNVIVTQATP